jgi:hypothetical protein
LPCFLRISKSPSVLGEPMRWWKTYRDDLDRPSFSIGMEKFGLDFFYDVACVWSFLCIENGPGVRQVELSDDVVKILARKFRVKPNEALERIRYMAEAGLIDITVVNGIQLLGSAEIERRRDEWSARNGKKKPATDQDTPERLPSHSGDTHDTELRGQRSESRDQRTESNELTRDAGNVTTEERACCLENQDPWKFCGLDQDRIPARFKRKFTELFHGEYERFKASSHEDGHCYCFVDEFIGSVREACAKAGVEYPKALLKRQTEIEELDRTSRHARAS